MYSNIDGEKQKLLRQIRTWILIMIVSILLSGITAFPLETELSWILGYRSFLAPTISEWLDRVYTGIRQTNEIYPFMAYGFDWLAFAHIVIALAFIGPLRDPIKNIWVIEWGMICCVLVFPLALIAGPVRSIPFFHQFIDCCFGIIGIIPLYIVWRKTKQLIIIEQRIVPA